MTGYTVHTGSTEQFSEGWDRIFTSKPKKSAAKPAAAKPAAKAKAKKKARRK